MSLAEHESGEGGNDQPNALVKEIPAYTPDLDAYIVDEANNPYRKLGESITDGATITLSLALADRSREIIELDHTESVAWLNGTPDERAKFATGKIRERHALVAKRAFERIGTVIIPTDKLNPHEEACLREFDMVVDARIPIEGGGYDKGLQLRESAIVDRGLREGFWDGDVGNEGFGYGYEAPTQTEYRPPGGPANQQLLISDVWDEQAKCYWAFHHDPAAKHACNVIADFVLGRGVQIIADDQNVQDVIDEFLDRDNIMQRLHNITAGLARDGEIFGRIIPLGDGRIKMRTLPPETIWEVVTDADDALDVYWYVQRYMTRVVLFAQNLPKAHARWIERTIPVDEMIHVKVNAKESDVRGRSDLYPALGWLKRLRDYADATVQKAYAAAAYQWHYAIAGGQADIQRIASQVIPSGKPSPGSYFISNDKVNVTPVSSGVRTGSSQGDVTYETLLNHIALSVGLTKEYFGASSHMARASALIATEPAAKTFEARQDVISDFITKLVHKALKEAQSAGVLAEKTDLGFRVQMPAIIKADAGTRIGLLRSAEASNYISHRRAAEEVATELEIAEYDYDDEMKQLKEELVPPKDGEEVPPWQIIGKDQQQVKKGLPSRSDVAFAPGDVPNPDDADTDPTNPESDAGDASPTSGVGAKKIRNEQGRGGRMDTSTIEAAVREARKSGGIVVIP